MTSPISLRLSADTLRQLDTLAEVRQVSRAVIVADAIETMFAAMTNQAAAADAIMSDPDARNAIEIAIRRALYPGKTQEK